MIRRLDNDERRAQLLAMGQAAFAAHPYDEVSIDDLARKAKISKGLFYYYFPTKRDLYIAGLRDTSQDLVVKLTSVPRDLAPRERATAAVDVYLEYVASQGSAFLALMRGGIGSDPEVSKVVEAVRVGILDEFLTGAPVSALLKTRPTSRIAIRAWIGAVEGASIEWLANQDLPREAVRELLVDMLFDLLTRLLGSGDLERLRASRASS
ncbi:MAG TPA: TetR/AcrR family transcriptional regulator [Kofleriaceae bacterium]|nr:TetR/AcrR family transcriptional regulator [Kofleriaceae bacterium]